MYRQRLPSVPMVEHAAVGKKTVEWEIPDRVAVALAFIKNYGYTVMAKVRVKKEHWWSRSWTNTAVHAPTIDESMEKCIEFLEKHGYTVEYDADRLAGLLGTGPDA
ncbi:MAG: hypothetical protein AVO35_08815 [Candidatus Aegiribacteria sp. MLS_C]|nr:MAG: hypothetical protein AVO35_08815 [Candidatus Aegiribacteria sp. MLS_C]